MPSVQRVVSVIQTQAVLTRNSGFTVVELLMATLIFIVGMLGLLQAVNLAMETNLRNQLRDEAATVGERSMNELRGKGFDSISCSATTYQTYAYRPYSVPSRIRGTSRKYGVQRNTVVLATKNSLPATKQLEVIVSWDYKGVTYQNRVVAPTSILR